MSTQRKTHLLDKWRLFVGTNPTKSERWFNPTALLWGGTIPPHLRPSKDGVLPNEVGKDEEGTLP